MKDGVLQVAIPSYIRSIQSHMGRYILPVTVTRRNPFVYQVDSVDREGRLNPL